jgi:hypothetical protein
MNQPYELTVRKINASLNILGGALLFGTGLVLLFNGRDAGFLLIGCGVLTIIDRWWA